MSYSEWCYGYTGIVVVRRSVPVLGIENLYNITL